MNRADTAVATALLLATLASVTDGPDPADAWQLGWQATFRTPGDRQPPMVVSAGEPLREYDRGYRDGLEHQGGRARRN
jgi:hypothetical protein